MSTIKAANLQNTSTSAPVFKNSNGTEIGQLAKAWVNFDGVNSTGNNANIRGSFNVSSVGDDGTGRYTVNFENGFANTNYCAVASIEFSTVNNQSTEGATFFAHSTRGNSSVRVRTGHTEVNSNQNVDGVNVVCFGA